MKVLTWLLLSVLQLIALFAMYVSFFSLSQQSFLDAPSKARAMLPPDCAIYSEDHGRYHCLKQGPVGDDSGVFGHNVAVFFASQAFLLATTMRFRGRLLISFLWRAPRSVIVNGPGAEKAEE
jgi:hypothetical protein